jgi:hypothetical protein
MGKIDVNDIKTIKEVVTTNAKGGFASFLATLFQYGLLIVLGFMLFEYDKAIEYCNNNVYQYWFFMLLIVIALYFIITYISTRGQTTVIDTYIKKQEEAKINAKRQHDIDGERRMKSISDIRNILHETLTNLNADRVSVFEMHNGTSNLSGLPFLYAAMTTEVYTPESGPAIDEYKDFNLAKYPFGTNHYNKLFICNSIDEIEKEDPLLALKMKMCKSEYLAIMVINGKHNRIGFLTVTFSNKLAIPNKDEIVAQMSIATQSISSYLDC